MFKMSFEVERSEFVEGEGWNYRTSDLYCDSLETDDPQGTLDATILDSYTSGEIHWGYMFEDRGNGTYYVQGSADSEDGRDDRCILDIFFTLKTVEDCESWTPGE